MITDDEARAERRYFDERDDAMYDLEAEIDAEVKRLTQTTTGLLDMFIDIEPQYDFDWRNALADTIKKYSSNQPISGEECHLAQLTEKIAREYVEKQEMYKNG